MQLLIRSTIHQNPGVYFGNTPEQASLKTLKQQIESLQRAADKNGLADTRKALDKIQEILEKASALAKEHPVIKALAQFYGQLDEDIEPERKVKAALYSVLSPYAAYMELGERPVGITPTQHTKQPGRNVIIDYSPPPKFRVTLNPADKSALQLAREAWGQYLDQRLTEGQPDIALALLQAKANLIKEQSKSLAKREIDAWHNVFQSVFYRIPSTSYNQETKNETREVLNYLYLSAE